jgi:predicted Ser/Thr protein kinase
VTSEQQRRVRDLFDAALDRASGPDGWAAWVTDHAGADGDVCAEVLSLLDHHSRAGAFLADPIVEKVPELFEGDDALPAGTMVGTYRIDRELGRGGMGRVYLATDTKLGRLVALKALAPHLLRDPQHRERLRREARAAAGLAHSGICTVFALEEIDGELYIASEYIEGRTLGDEIHDGHRPGPGEALRTARELAAALAHAHAAGIVHRDLKPDNVMRTRDGGVKILDFGLARLERPAPEWTDSPSLTAAGVLVGTPAYMAPEQINGEPVDARADVFALGVVLYEYTAGVHPFQGATSLATVARILESDARPIGSVVPELPAGLAGVIARCLRKSPADRFASAGEVLAALDVWATSAPDGPRPATWWRTHQLVVLCLYAGMAAVGWRIKAWHETAVTIGLFLALGAMATVGGVLRGHLVFTEWMSRVYLAAERRRATPILRAIDAAMGTLMAIDALILAQMKALPALFTLALGIAVVVTSLMIEPATTRATFGPEAP